MNLSRQKIGISKMIEKVGPRIEKWTETSFRVGEQVRNSEGAVCGLVSRKRDGRLPIH